MPRRDFKPAAFHRQTRAARMDFPESISASGLAEMIEKGNQALKVGELANLLNINNVTLYRHAKSGAIPSFRVGKIVRFDPKIIAKWLRNGCWYGK